MPKQMPLFRCTAVVEKPEELRLVRGKGFRRHYTRVQCSRPAGEGGLCWQHTKGHAVLSVFRTKWQTEA